MGYGKILKQSIDLHVHIGPEIIPRKFTLRELVKAERRRLKGICVKNHFFPTVAMNTCDTLTVKNPFIIHSVTLNNYVGGFNSKIIRISAEMSPYPVMVWFPTLHAKNFLRKQNLEIPLEWVDSRLRSALTSKSAKDVKGLSVFDESGKVKKEIIEVLRTIKAYGAILATGHISWQESYSLVKFAVKKIGIKKVVVTHPVYQHIDMPLPVQKELTRLGAFIEHCFSMYIIDKIPIRKIANQIKYVGPEKCILSSDVGQTFTPRPSEALLKFVTLLEKEDVPSKKIRLMLVDNPNYLASR